MITAQEEVPDRRDFHRLYRQFSDQELIQQLFTRRERTGRLRIHWRKEERVIAYLLISP